MRKITSLGLFLMCNMLFLMTTVQAKEPLAVGQMAPEFETVNQKGQTVKLSDFRGKKVILYFYPKDDTPGCTKEAKTFRDNIKGFESKNAVILGVSFDDQSSHQQFSQKYDLPFQLLVDADKSIAKAYEASGLIWASRDTFVIDEKGKILQILRAVKPAEHVRGLLDSF